MSEDSAQNFMLGVERIWGSNTERVRYLSPKALYLLAAPSDARTGEAGSGGAAALAIVDSFLPVAATSTFEKRSIGGAGIRVRNLRTLILQHAISCRSMLRFSMP